MATRTDHVCIPHEKLAALAAAALPVAERDALEVHLETCEICRGAWRELTADDLPRFRSYTILRAIGRGGFGVVYKAVHHGKQRVEALKVLFSKTPLREAYFQNEVHLAAKLRHPHIATLYEAHLTSPPMYYAMEYIAGQQFNQYVHEQHPPLEERLRIVQQVAAAVHYAHSEGVVHRDLKPQNILIDEHGQPHIVDFGISKRVVLEGGTGREIGEGVLGTYGYIAPEQLGGTPVDHRADIFGLGALLFHVVTGQPPGLAREPEKVLRLLKERGVARAADLAAIISRCVSADPGQRYASAAHLANDLDQYKQGWLVAARSEHTVPLRAARLGAVVVRSYPRAVQMAATVLLAIILTATLWSSGARWLPPAATEPQAALVAFTDTTFAALRNGDLAAELPGVRPANRKSWRVLYGRLLEKLAHADVQAVAWDYFFPDDQPDYDPALAAGVKALGRPVVVGSRTFDINAEPQINAALRSVVHACGALVSVKLAELEQDGLAPLAIQRGFGDPIPALAVAAYAAARHPDSNVALRLAPEYIELRYHKRDAAPGVARWYSETDRLHVYEVVTAGQGAGLQPNDRLYQGRYSLAEVAAWRTRAIPMERVLAADEAQLRRWFGGKVVLVGQMLPLLDVHRLKDGQAIFGCQAQAALLDALLAERQPVRYNLGQLVPRVCLGCLVGAAIAIAALGRVTMPLRWVSGAAIATAVLGVVGASYAAVRITGRAEIELAMALAAAVAASGPVILIQCLHRHQQALIPAGAVKGEVTTGSTTLVASPFIGSGASSRRTSGGSPS